MDKCILEKSAEGMKRQYILEGSVKGMTAQLMLERSAEGMTGQRMLERTAEGFTSSMCRRNAQAMISNILSRDIIYRKSLCKV